MRFPFTKNELFFASVYFVQAMVGISALAQFLFTRNELGLDFLQLGILSALPTISWSIKPLYGFLTDLVPIKGYRRRPYLHIMPLVTLFSWLWIWQFADSFIGYAIPLMIANVGLGFTDVICDGLVVQESNEKTAGRYQSICWGSLTVGAIVATFLSGLLLGREILEIRDMFLLTALMPLITFGLSFFIKEKKITDRAELKVHKVISSAYIWAAMVAFILTILLMWPWSKELNMQRMSFAVIAVWFIWFAFYFKHLMDLKVIGSSIFAAVIFTFLWRFTPSFGAPWQDYFLNQIGVDQETFGYFGVMQYIGWLIGSIGFAKWLDKKPLKKVLKWTLIASAFFGLSQLTLTTPETANAVGSNIFIKYVGAVLATPVFLMARGTEFWSHLMQYDGIIFLRFFLDFWLGILYMLSFLALLKFVALSTPKNLEGTNFAVMASVMNFGLVFGSISGGMIFESASVDLATAGLFSMSRLLEWLAINPLQMTILLGSATTLLALIVLPYIKTDHMPHE